MKADAELLELFRLETDAQAAVMTDALLALERDASSADHLDLCMRAAHSLKGAARIVGLDLGVGLAHAMEDCFVAAREKRISLGPSQIDALLRANDLLVRIAHTPEAELGRWQDSASGLNACLDALARALGDEPVEDVGAPGRAEPAAPPAEAAAASPAAPPADAAAPAVYRDNSDRILRVTAENLNVLLGLAGESLVESRWVKPFAESLLRAKRMQQELYVALDGLRQQSVTSSTPESAVIAWADALSAAQKCHLQLSERLEELEMFERRTLNLAHRLYGSARACRMRPFADGIQSFPRLVRDVAQRLGKQVRLEITGEATQVDRDVLSKLDAPLGHLLRNAVDHGIETPAERRAAGKPDEGLIRIDARHSAGALHVTVTDDGRGVDIEKTRDAVVARGLLGRDAAQRLTDAELCEFLFLPGFTMKSTVTEVSGRGVGLDVVQDMVKQVRGVVRISSTHGKGTRFQLQLPVTLSVVRTLLAEIGGEPYAFPLAYIVRTFRISTSRIAQLEGRQHCEMDGRRVGLVMAHQVLDVAQSVPDSDELSVIVLGDPHQPYGLVVDRFLGERELVVQRLDPRLGKIKDIAAGALMEDASPVLIVDPEDLIRSMERLASDGHLRKVDDRGAQRDGRKRKRVLVVDDSLTVRELERKLLGNHGYHVEIAVDGMDGWNAARMGDFDLIITDIDMPRMDGIELVKRVNNDPRLKSRPIIVVSYKDRDEDRRRGLEAGAAYYLTKGSFHDQTLVQAVVDLIGEAHA
jgi:two-component system sensor histidine kinase and response regulator WspE